MLTQDQKDSFSLPIGDEEVWNAVRAMGPLKAPGPEGLKAIFFQKQWKVVGKSKFSF